MPSCPKCKTLLAKKDVICKTCERNAKYDFYVNAAVWIQLGMVVVMTYFINDIKRLCQETTQMTDRQCFALPTVILVTLQLLQLSLLLMLYCFDVIEAARNNKL